MSEQNILNPSASSPLSPDWPIKEVAANTMARAQARSGRLYSRRVGARGPAFQLQWTARPLSTYYALQQWFAQYEQGYFSLYDVDRNRYYTGAFDDQPQFERVGNQSVNISAGFMAIPGLPLYQYPSAWGVDSVMRDERDDFFLQGLQGPRADAVKLTGTWDHRTSNYALFSQDFEQPAWGKAFGCVVAADNGVDPLGGNTADLLVSGNAGASGVFQGVAAVAAVYTFSLHVRAGTSTQIQLGIFDGAANAWVGVTPLVLSGPGANGGGNPTTITGLTAAWTRVSLTTNAPLASGRTYTLFAYPDSQAANPLTNYVWGAQWEIAPAASLYTQTGAAPAELLAPAPNPACFGGAAYFNPGTNAGDCAEWLYMGYGFRLWSPKAPNFGLAQVSLDNAAQGVVDLYAPALTASAPVFTQPFVALGTHRVKVAATNAKNPASADFIAVADAIEVMR